MTGASRRSAQGRCAGSGPSTSTTASAATAETPPRCSTSQRRTSPSRALRPVPWPASAAGQIAALRDLAAQAPLGVDEAARRFTGARADLVARHLETLAILGEVQPVGDRRYGVAAAVY